MKSTANHPRHFRSTLPQVAARLFVDLLYTGSSTADVDAEATLLDALRLAHRWDVRPVVDMLERALTRQLECHNFEDLAEVAQVLELPALRRACKLLAVADVNISYQLQKRRLRPAVLELLAPPPVVASSGPAAKRRRTF